MENSEAVQSQAPQKQGPSESTKLLVVVILLIFVYPIGVIMMWQWMKTWSWQIKFILTMPAIVIILALIYFLVTSLKPPEEINEQAQGLTAQNRAEEFVNATEKYVILNNDLPCQFPDSAPGAPIASLSDCTEQLIDGFQLNPEFLTDTASLSIINVHYDRGNATLYACIEDKCISKIVASSEFTDQDTNILLTSPSPVQQQQQQIAPPARGPIIGQ